MKLKYYLQVSFPKTLYVNFRVLPLRSALKLPIVIFRHTKIVSLKGRVIIDAPVRHGMIKVGRCDTVGWTGKSGDLRIDGTVRFAGSAVFGSGSTLFVQKGGVVSLGKGFCTTAGTSILCEKSIVIGDRFLSSWDNLIMDSDFHHIQNAEGETVNAPREITIGNRVWMGCRTTVLKGCNIPDDTVVASGSILTGKFEETGTVIGGAGSNQKVLKRNITWHA